MGEVNVARSLQVAKETVEQGVMLAPGHTAALLALVDDLDGRLAHLERAMLRAMGEQAKPSEALAKALAAPAAVTD